MLKESDDSRTE
jgi:hypothetical protein